MAETYIPSGLTVQQWDDKYFVEYVTRNWFKKFQGTGTNAMIQVKEDLTQKPGGTVHFTFANKLKGKAKNELDTLEGQEEDINLRSQAVTIREYKHAVKWSNFQAQLTAIDLRQVHKDLLMTWNMELDRDNLIAALGEMSDGTLFANATAAQKNTWAANNSDRILFGNSKSNYSATFATGAGNVNSTTGLLSADSVSLMKRMAKTASPKIRPYKPRASIEDSAAYVVFVPTIVLRDLQQDPAFVQANREARERGSNNPLFDSADYVYDNCAIYEIEDLPIYTGIGGSGIDLAPVYLTGAQALGIAWAKRPETVDELMDYKTKNGLAIKQWYRCNKLRFGSGTNDSDTPKDNGIVTGLFAAVSD